MATETGIYSVGGEGFIGRFFEAPEGATLDPTKYQANADGYKPVPGLSWIAGDKSAARVLPAGRTTASADAADSEIYLDIVAPFVDGDVLTVLPPMAYITLALTWAASDTLEVVIGGVTFEYTVASSVISEITVAFAAAVNADPSLSQMVTAIDNNNTVFFVSNDYLTPYTIATTATTAGNGTSTVANSQTSLLPNQSAGTIATNGVDLVAKEITLSGGGLGVSVPAGISIGVPGLSLLGLSRSELELTETDNLNIGVYTKANIRSETLPYYDGATDRLFPQIKRV